MDHDDIHEPGDDCRAVLELSWDAALVCDARGELVFVNGEASRLFGGDRKKLEGRHIQDLLHKQVGSFYIEAQTRLKQDDHYEGEALAVRDDTGQAFSVRVRAALAAWDGRPAMLTWLRPFGSEPDAAELDAELQARFDELAYKTSVGQMAVGVMHNVGNVLNSVNIGAQSLAELTRSSKIPELIKANKLFEENRHRIQEYIERDPAGRYLPQFYLNVGRYLARNNEIMMSEAAELQKHLALIKELIATQQDYARESPTATSLSLARLVEDVLKIERLPLEKHQITVDLNLPDQAYARAPKAKALHVLLNLVKNAREAILMRSDSDRRIEIKVKSAGEEHWALEVRDNGVGISQEQMRGLFKYGYTTKLDGHGFGLYTSMRVMEEMGGSLSATSDGADKGASFSLVFPAGDVA